MKQTAGLWWKELSSLSGITAQIVLKPFVLIGKITQANKYNKLTISIYYNFDIFRKVCSHILLSESTDIKNGKNGFIPTDLIT